MNKKTKCLECGYNENNRIKKQASEEVGQNNYKLIQSHRNNCCYLTHICSDTQLASSISHSKRTLTDLAEEYFQKRYRYMVLTANPLGVGVLSLTERCSPKFS